MKHITSAYFIGIGGVGMSGIARVANDQGMTVTGSDMKESRYTRQLKEAVYKKKRNVWKDFFVALVLVGAAAAGGWCRKRSSVWASNICTLWPSRWCWTATSPR